MSIIEVILELVTVLLVTLIGVLGTWLTLKIGKKEELAAINAAQQEVILNAPLTVEELKQTVVDELKAKNTDGKLTKDEITALGELLLENTVAKMCAPSIKLLQVASVDITELIKGAGESWIAAMKKKFLLDFY